MFGLSNLCSSLVATGTTVASNAGTWGVFGMLVKLQMRYSGREEKGREMGRNVGINTQLQYSLRAEAICFVFLSAQRGVASGMMCICVGWICAFPAADVGTTRISVP